MKMNTEKLVANVYQRRALWDKSDRMYHNRDFARDKWQEVCVELGLQKSDVELVKKRWNCLRDVFRREYQKAIKSEDPENSPTWSHYKSMSFLCSQTKLKPPTEPVEPELLVCEDSIPENYEEPLSQPIKRHYSEEIDPFEEDIKIFKSHSTLNPPTPSCGGSEDSDYHFLMSLLPFLRTVPQHRKLALRIRLQQVISEEQASIADQSQSFNGIYQPNSTSNDSTQFVSILPTSNEFGTE